jgi:hypothetical protein
MSIWNDWPRLCTLACPSGTIRKVHEVGGLLEIAGEQTSWSWQEMTRWDLKMYRIDPYRSYGRTKKLPRFCQQSSVKLLRIGGWI